MEQWRTTVGIEVHVRLRTLSKMFCPCPNSFGDPPNTNVCPVCLGYPGSLPVLNAAAVGHAVAAALAFGCTIHRRSTFARKNYFYPDLPKGYQITQYDLPLATGGAVSIPGGESIPLRRIHLEEDAGKLLHEVPGTNVSATESLVDFNRAGAPLVEIVTEPSIHSPEVAIACLNGLRQTLMFAGVTDGNMEEGSVRCDVNVSVAREGQPAGTRVEIKNLNSFRFAGRAIQFESSRQREALERGDRVIQETRLYDVASGETRPMRSKEEATDYRYFNEPDVPVLVVGEELIASVRERLPELPHERALRYEREMQLPRGDAEVLVTAIEIAEYFEEVAAASGNVRASANWVRNEILRVVNDTGVPINRQNMTPARLASLLRMLDSGAVGGKAAKEILEIVTIDGGEPDQIAESRGLSQITDEEALAGIVREVVRSHPQQAESFRGGRRALFGFFVGQVMKQTGGRAHAETVNRLLEAELSTH